VPTGPFRFVGLIGAMTGNRNVHERELRVDYPKGGQVSLYGADNPDALRGIYLDGIVLDEYLSAFGAKRTLPARFDGPRRF
jgi:hypothetical protein